MKVSPRFLLGFLAAASVVMLSGCATPPTLTTYINNDEAITLIRNGADVNAIDERGEIPLCYTARRSMHIDVVKLLIEKGADVNGTDGNGWTPLSCAIKDGAVEMSKLLIQKGANVNANAGSTSSPLKVAISHGYIELAELLIKYNVDVNSADNEGNTPLFFARVLGKKTIEKLLIANGAKASVRNKAGLTAEELKVQSDRNVKRQEQEWQAQRDKYEAQQEAKKEQERRDKAESREMWKGIATLGAGIAVGNATRNLAPDQQERMMRSSMNSVQSGDASEIIATTQQVKAERTQEHNAKMQAIEAQKEREDADAKEAEAANNRRMMDASMRSHQPSAQNTTNRQQPSVQPWNNQANRSANSNANSSRNAGNTQIALNQNGVRADSSSDNENWKSAFTPKLSWADCEKRAKELHGRCDRAEIFKPAFTAADRSAAEQSKLCSETKNRALNSNFYAIVEDLGCGCYLHEGNLHCTYFTIGKSRHKSVGGGKSK